MAGFYVLFSSVAKLDTHVFGFLAEASARFFALSYGPTEHENFRNFSPSPRA